MNPQQLFHYNIGMIGTLDERVRPDAERWMRDCWAKLWYFKILLAKEKLSGMRTDRNNNPIAVAMTSTFGNQFTKALDTAGIPWEPGDKFPGFSIMRTIRILGDPIEGARAILAGSTCIQDWYINHTGKTVLPKYKVKNNKDFWGLSREDQNAIIKGIYEEEGGDGRLVDYHRNRHVQGLALDILPTGGGSYGDIEGVGLPYGVSRPLVGIGDLGHYEIAIPEAKEPVVILSRQARIHALTKRLTRTTADSARKLIQGVIARLTERS